MHAPRLPGAGEFGTTYRCYAKLLLNERNAYGAVYSEGSMQWLYAGLAGGSDAELDSPPPHLEPFLVDFDLRKIHPLEMDAGMSWIHRYVESPEAAEALGGWEAAQDRFTAATLAFGHQGTFTALSFRGYSTDIKTYYMLRPLQELYAMRRAEEILYHDPATRAMLDVSAALHSGAYREGQVYIRYETGLRVWVNGSLHEPWAVDCDGATYTLPPSGFRAMGPQGEVSESTTTGIGRADFSSYAGTSFADARGKLQDIGPFRTDGAALLKQTAGKRWTLWPLGDMTYLSATFAGEGLTADAYDEQGELVPGVDAEFDGERVVLPVDSGAFRYEIAAR